MLTMLCLASCSDDDTSSMQGCPGNNLRSESGKCGCDWPHPEKDDDKYWDESENRCIDPTTNPTINCPGNVEAVDKDNDGTLDCLEDQGCDNNPLRTHAGRCGCNWPYPQKFDDYDYDKDGTLDCHDNKHNDNDGGKTEPGFCGFGMKETDTDKDGTPDCIDACPYNAQKTTPGVCGCGIPDDDTDGDGTPDCADKCIDDPNKIDPGVCGCGEPDIDSDNDYTLDCKDPYPYSHCTDSSPFFNATENLYCIKNANDFYLLHQQQTTNLEGAKIHILKDINLGDLNNFMNEAGDCLFDFSVPKDPSNPSSEKDLPDSFLHNLTHYAEFISADDEIKTITLDRNVEGKRIRCPLPYPLFDEIKNSKVERIRISLDIQEDTIDPYQATASLAHKTQGAHIEDVIFDGEIQVNAWREVGGLVSIDYCSTFKNVRCEHATINAPNAESVGGIVGHVDPCSNSATTIYHTSPDHKHTVSSITGSTFAGGVVGRSYASLSIHNMSVSLNTLTANDRRGGYAGALIGYTTVGPVGSTLQNIDLTFDTITSSDYAGGLIGSIPASNLTNIKNIISIGRQNITGKTVGGLIGKVISTTGESLTLQNIYSAVGNDDTGDTVSKISGTFAAGGLIGKAEVGVDLNNVSIYVREMDTSEHLGAIVGYMALSKPQTWTNVTAVTKLTSTDTTKGGFICGSIAMEETAKLTFQNTVVGGITNNTSYPLISNIIRADCDKGNTCFEGTNAYYFYQTKPGELDPQSKLDSIFTPVDSSTSVGTSDIIDKLNAAFPMPCSWKLGNVVVGNHGAKKQLMFPVFKDYLNYLMGIVFETPEGASGEQ